MVIIAVSNVDWNVGLSSVGFGFRLSSELMVRDQGGDFWDEEDKDLPFPLGDFLPSSFLDWAFMGDQVRGWSDSPLIGKR